MMRQRRSHEGTDWAAVWAVVAAGILTAFHLGKVAIAAPQLQHEFGLSLTEIGGLAAGFALLGALAGLPAGSLVARTDDRSMLIIGWVATAGGAALAPVASGFGMLLVSRATEGLGFLLITVAGPVVLRRVTAPGQLNTVYALWSCFMPAGLALAMVAGPWFGDWRLLWWASVAAAGAVGVAVARQVPAQRPSAGGRPAAEVPEPVGAARLGTAFALAGIFLCYSLMFFALFSFLPVLLEQRMQMDRRTVGWLSGLASAANIVGNLSAAFVLSRFARPSVVAGAAVTMAVCGLGIFLPAFDPAVTLALCLAFSSIGGLIPATLLSSVPHLAATPRSAALVVGLLMQGSNLGQALGPVVVGSVIDAHGWPAAAAAVVAAALLIVLATRSLARGRLVDAPA
ncbi:MFS transporter [Schlegelella sp. S2-27]|uniref:MFS transporter n=1 Tax=Caldimonas mangrovi TaxID=2944811 RepID=A0ABT0YT49_9BURK|nr:MFS transporter [Caldimonas mangrovi]MCM5681920.1 MFS transporter [Caldimonas mangrovi]